MASVKDEKLLLVVDKDVVAVAGCQLYAQLRLPVQPRPLHVLRVPEPKTVVFFDRVAVLVASAVDDDRVPPSICGMFGAGRGDVSLAGLRIDQGEGWVVVVKGLAARVVFAWEKNGMDVAVAQLAVDIFAAEDVGFVTDGGDSVIGPGKGSPVWIRYG